MSTSTHKRGRPPTGLPIPQDRETKPIWLKQLLAEAGISNREFATLVGVSPAAVNLVMNKQYLPKDETFKHRAENALGSLPEVTAVLDAQGKTLADIWQPVGEKLHALRPANMHERQSAAQQNRHTTPAIVPGNPNEKTPTVEVEMISQEAMKHFKLFRNPFIDDVLKEADIYMSDDHRYIEAAMLDAARHAGFLAVIGEVGSGKSIMRRKVIGQLQKDGDMLVIYPQVIDKTRVTAGSICDAMVYDLSTETPKRSLEAKTRQVHRLLLDRAKSGYRSVLIIEEAHDLLIQTLKFLKRFSELEDGYKKLTGIILVGQTELKDTLDESKNVDMREVIRRIQVAEIKGLNGDLRKYLEVKFKRVGRDVSEIFDDDAFAVLSKRLTSVDRDNRKVSHAYPLLVNNFTARAMNMAFELGESRITADVIEAL